LISELDFVQLGNSSIRFIQGEYGSGKTFLSLKLSEIAKRKGFAVSTVIISPSNLLCNLSDIYETIIENLAVKDKIEVSGFIDILDAWSYNHFSKVKKIEPHNNNSENSDSIVASLYKNIEYELVSAQNIHPLFAKCVLAYAKSKINRDYDKARMAISWFKGIDKISNFEYRKELGIKGKLENKDVLSFLKGLVYLIKDTGYNGLLLIFDEIETIQRLQIKKQRQESYETIRVILDEVGLNNFKNVFFIMTGTPQFFQDRKFGIPSYSALYERISEPSKVYGDSIKQPILKLKKLNEDFLIEISKKVIKLYGEAYSWDPQNKISDSIIKDLIKVFAENFGEINTKPRDYLRRLIKLLDLTFENQEESVYNFIKLSTEP
jgi:adenosylhomocysteinase